MKHVFILRWEHGTPCVHLLSMFEQALSISGMKWIKTASSEMLLWLYHRNIFCECAVTMYAHTRLDRIYISSPAGALLTVSYETDSSLQGTHLFSTRTKLQVKRPLINVSGIKEYVPDSPLWLWLAECTHSAQWYDSVCNRQFSMQWVECWTSCIVRRSLNLQ